MLISKVRCITGNTNRNIFTKGKLTKLVLEMAGSEMGRTLIKSIYDMVISKEMVTYVAGEFTIDFFLKE